MTTLVPMREALYADYLAHAMAAYAEENVAAGRWPNDGALERSRDDFQGLLPQGLSTPDNHLFEICAGDDPAAGSARVGWLWIAMQGAGGQRAAYVYDIEIFAAHRRRGHAARAFAAAETLVRGLGAASLGLHVFVNNPGARALYEKLGFHVTGLNLMKPLPRSDAPREPADAPSVFERPEVLALRRDLSLALRAAAHHGYSEGVCNHFSVALPDGSDRFLINPRGLHWSEVGADDIVMVDGDGAVLAGRHGVEPTAMYIHAAVHRIAGQACVLHVHMPYATALTLTAGRALDTTLSQNAMRFHGRIAIDDDYRGLALDAGEGERIAGAMQGADVAFLGNHGVIVCSARIDHAYDDLYYLERACQLQVIAESTGRTLMPVAAALAARVGEQTAGERLQSELFFAALRRQLGDR